MPPSMLVDESDRPRRPRWTWQDRLIIQAYQDYESSLCEGCALDRERAMNPEMAGHAQIHSHTCYGCQALETVRQQQKDEKGVKNYVIDAGPEEMDPHSIILAPIDEGVYAEVTAAPGGGEMVKIDEPGL